MLGMELVLATHLLLKASSDVVVCPSAKSAVVDVRWRSEPVKYDNTKTSAALEGHKIDSENPYGVHVSTDVGGLMSGKVTYNSGISVSSVRYPTSEVTCLWVDKVKIDIVIDPIVQIAAEHPQGTCEYDAIMEHEKHHVAIDRDVVKEYLEQIRRAAAEAVQKVGMVGPKPDSTMESYKQKMSDYISSSVKLKVEEMYAVRTKRQKAFDNKEEYDRVQAVCEKK